MICVTNMCTDAINNRFRRPHLSTNAMAPNVANTFTARQNDRNVNAERKACLVDHLSENE